MADRTPLRSARPILARAIAGLRRRCAPIVARGKIWQMALEAATNPIPLEREELIARLRWLIRVRWYFGATVWIAGILLYFIPVGTVSGTFVAAIGAGILVYNWVFWFLERHIGGAQPEVLADRAPVAAMGQIVLDLIALTVVLHSAGGIENPFFVYYVFHMVIATLLLPVREVFGVAALAIVLFGALVLAEMKGWVPHATLWTPDQYYRDPRFVAGTLSAFGSALIIAVFLGTRIASTLRAREREVLRLKGELAARAQELEQANASLREADEAKTQYFRQVSHDLKAPVAAQQSLLRVLLVEVPDLKPAPRSRIERAIVRGDELLLLLNDLLMLSRTRDATRRPQCERIDPLERLRPVLDAQELQAKEKGLTWQLDVREPLPQVCVEPGAWMTVAENLLSNAIKYTPKGGTVIVTFRGQDDHLVLEVRDTGIGIAREDLPRIGEEFFRSKQARQSGSPGTGLGMTIVRSMVERMSGDVDIQSDLGKGTAVTVRLPAVHPDGVNDSPAHGEPGVMTGGSPVDRADNGDRLGGNVV
jgi:signal transduction histidine kinase